MEWDLESGECPYGHALSRCWTRYPRKDGSYRDACRIHRGELARRSTADRRALIAAGHTTAGGVKPRRGAGRPATTADQRYAEIVLVCGHATRQQRTDCAFLQEKLYCGRCGEWRHIHEVSATRAGERGTLVFPLVARPRKVPTHTPDTYPKAW
jgi:hypothetical protein